MMKAFVNYNKKKATVARNRIVHQTLATENAENLTPSLLSYILKNPDRYGFQALRSSFGDKSEACFCMSHQPDFDVERGRTSPSHVAISPPDFTYTLVMYPTDMASNMSNIQLDQQPTSIDGSLVKQCPLSFILLLNKSGSFNVAYADSATSGFFPVQDLGEIGALQEYLAEGFYLGDIVRYGIKKIERLVDQVKKFIHSMLS